MGNFIHPLFFFMFIKDCIINENRFAISKNFTLLDQLVIWSPSIPHNLEYNYLFYDLIIRN